MKRGRRHDTNRGPQFKTMHRSEKTQEWAKIIQTMLRHHSGSAIGDEEAIDYADQFWRSLEGRHTPIKDIAASSGSNVAIWALNTYGASLVAKEKTE